MMQKSDETSEQLRSQDCLQISCSQTKRKIVSEDLLFLFAADESQLNQYSEQRISSSYHSE